MIARCGFHGNIIVSTIAHKKEVGPCTTSRAGSVKTTSQGTEDCDKDDPD